MAVQAAADLSSQTHRDDVPVYAIGVRAAIELCGVDRVVFGSDFGPVPYGIKEHVQIVADVSRI